MKKQIFQDLITETRLPVNLWLFFLISIVGHIALVTLFVTVEFPQPDVEIHVKRRESGERRRMPSGTPEAVPAFGTQAGSSVPNDTPGMAASPPANTVPATAGNNPNSRNTGKTGAPGTFAEGYNPNPALYSSDPQVPIDLTKPAPAAVYQHPVQNTGLDITGDQYVKLYNKPFLDAGKKPSSVTPLYRPSPSSSSYNDVKQYIQRREIPPAEMIKIEELVNSFQYEYPLPEDGMPFSVTTELRPCPWHPSHLLLHLGIQGKIVEADDALRNRDFVVARNMTINLDFNPKRIKAYRLVGYAESKPLPGKAPSDPRKKGQDLRMGQATTTLYELIPAEIPGKPAKPEPSGPAPRIATIDISYRQPGKKTPSLMAYDIFQEIEKDETASDDFNFSAAVAQFGMLLKNPEFEKITDLQKIMQLALDAMGEDKRGYRAEFIKLLERYKVMKDKL